ncbi:uncharacterized protein LOC124820623 [Vigna umbellata]|uniref:uncharacterized protein LOC124820623 n=1 Tax=Vigna umbellata TaxID=87088 RepID=UPI001F5E9429|nr:uncharacterized protein LOC124820623 [Vigna umbellata]
MANRSPPSPPHNLDTSNVLRMMESVLEAMQQQNTALVHQHIVALQQLDAVRVSVETSQRKYLDLMLSGRATAGSSSSNHPQEWSLESFLQHHPAKFDDKCSPDEVDNWFRDMERIYNANRCSDDNRLAYSEYLLTEEASHWWTTMRVLLESSVTPISWEVFKKFYTEYFPDSVRFAKEVEFLQLVQGTMSVFEYADRKFENGLRGNIKLVVAGLCIKEFPVFVERAKILEKTKIEVEGTQKQQPRVGGSISAKSGLSPSRTPYARFPSTGSRGQSSQSTVSFGQSSSGAVRCFIYGGPHYQVMCPQGAGFRMCNRCQRERHFERDCPLGRRASGQPHQAGRFQSRGGGVGGRAQATGRVYALSGTKAANLAAGEVKTATYCAKFPIVVEGRRFKVNLICLALQGLEVILGMNWLAVNHILIDYGEKKLVFPEEEQEESL